MKAPRSKVVKVGSVSLRCYPWPRRDGRVNWRFAWHDPETGARRYTTRATEDSIRQAAREKAIALGQSLPTLQSLSPEARRNLGRLLRADPHLRFADDYLMAIRAERPTTTVRDALDEFLALKSSNRGRSSHNLRTLRKNLGPLAEEHGSRPLSSLTVADLEAHLGANPDHSARTRRNVRASIVTFSRWAARAGHLPEGVTAAERTEAPIVDRKAPETWSPSELATMLAGARAEYLPWLAACAFGGFRAEEINPHTASDKRPLDWADIKWDRSIIVVRPETAKIGERRIVPILPALRDWLYPIRKESGPVGTPKTPPSVKHWSLGNVAETQRLGALVGGWRRNALRHSWISYRAALVGLGRAAMEAGNSERESRRSYNDAKSQAEADEWFSVNRTRVAELLRNPLEDSA